jgi:hypothetical protein
MNNIEILEELVERCKECKFACCEQCEINNTQIKAIENLIKENKELKEEIKSLNKIIKYANDMLAEEIENRDRWE